MLSKSQQEQEKTSFRDKAGGVGRLRQFERGSWIRECAPAGRLTVFREGVEGCAGGGRAPQIAKKVAGIATD